MTDITFCCPNISRRNGQNVVLAKTMSKRYGIQPSGGPKADRLF